MPRVEFAACGDAPTDGHLWRWFRRRESERMLRELEEDGWYFPPDASLAWCAYCARYRVHARGFECVLRATFTAHAD